MKRIAVTLLALLSISFARAAESGPSQASDAVIAASAESRPAKRDVKEEALTFILDKAKLYTGKMENAVGQAVDVAQKEAPETIRQFLVWRAIKHILTFMLPFVTCITATVLTFSLGKKSATWNTWRNDRYEVGTYVCAVIAIIMGIGTCACFPELFSFIQIQVAPRIYLIEQVSHLIQ